MAARFIALRDQQIDAGCARRLCFGKARDAGEKDAARSLQGRNAPLADGEGKALARWEPIQQLLNDYEADLERTREMCAILSDYALLEPFTLQANLKDAGPMNLAGMYRVEEKKLEFLNAAQHRNLFKKGVMGRIYTHLLSLDNFARLMVRKANNATSKAA